MRELVDAGRLDPGESTGLLEHYDQLQEAVDAATTHAVRWRTRSGVILGDFVNALADHAKYVYAVGSRDIAALQYRLTELAHTGRLDVEAHKRLRWDHCLRMWEALYHGTTSAVRDERTWDGMWDWSDNTYHDARQVMMQARVKGREILDRKWPYSEGICGDGPVQEILVPLDHALLNSGPSSDASLNRILKFGPLPARSTPVTTASCIRLREQARRGPVGRPWLRISWAPMSLRCSPGRR
jgi:hypothetical protein